MTYNGEKIVRAGIHNFNFKTFTWNLIDICNQQCAYCNEGFGSEQFRPKSSFFKNQSQLDSYKTVLKILKLKSIGPFEVDIIGGEPTLHPYIYEIIEEVNSIENCKEISLLTNFKKPFSFYEKFDSQLCSKLIACLSIHFDYYSHEILEKCISASKFKHIRMVPLVMLHDDKKHWDNMENFIMRLIENNIEYNISFLNSCYNYVVNYSDEFYSRFNKYFVNDDSIYLFNDSLKLTKYDIQTNNLKHFNGWTCKPLRYNIKHTGEILNACTKERMSFLNEQPFVKCSYYECNCNVQWNYEKYAE